MSITPAILADMILVYSSAVRTLSHLSQVLLALLDISERDTYAVADPAECPQRTRRCPRTCSERANKTIPGTQSYTATGDTISESRINRYTIFKKNTHKRCLTSVRATVCSRLQLLRVMVYQMPRLREAGIGNRT
jgi:hypothetical protein